MIEIYTALLAFNIHKRTRAHGHHKDVDRKSTKKKENANTKCDAYN